MATEPKRLRREWSRAEDWRDTKAGMWAWLLVRVSAVLVVLLVVCHLIYPYAVSVQFLLFLGLTFHGVLGVRVILMDLGLGLKYHKSLLAGLLLLGLVVFVLAWWGRS